MKKLFTVFSMLLCGSVAFAQEESKATTDDDIVVTGTEYIPIEGRIVPGVRSDLEGKWVLRWGIKKEKARMDFDLSKKPKPGEVVSRDTVVTTETVNGVTKTVKEVEYREIQKPVGNQITPPQGNKAHIPERPNISFFGANETVSGFTGCNKFSGRFHYEGNELTFKVAPSTKMECIGNYDEGDFMQALRSVDSFRTNGGNLELLNGGKVVLVFARK